MSILIEEERRPFPWFPIVIGLLIVSAIAVGTYAIFFAAKPGIEVVLPPALRSADEIAKLKLKVVPSKITSDTKFGALKSYAGPPSVGELGKANPFTP